MPATTAPEGSQPAGPAGSPPRRTQGLGPITRTWIDVVPRILPHILKAAALLSLLGGLGLSRTSIYPALDAPFWWLGMPTDVMPQWAGSSWYQLRYINPAVLICRKKNATNVASL